MFLATVMGCRGLHMKLIVIPMLSLLLAIFPVFRVFTTLLTFIYSGKIYLVFFLQK